MELSKKVAGGKRKPRAHKLKKTLTPGTVVIILAGPFAGKRCVFLKQLEKSGLLLVTGPYKLNGVPLRRVDQTRVIATSTKVDISKVEMKVYTDSYFKLEKADKEASKTERDIFMKQGTVPQRTVATERKAAQAAVDESIMAAIGKDRMMRGYLRSTFNLISLPPPHLLKW